jgi:hypothetical protein
VVKPEPHDPSTVPGNQTPAAASTAPAQLDETAPAPILERIYTRHSSASEIAYNTDDALQQGHAMVKTIQDAIKKIVLGSKLREEVWDREMQRCAISRLIGRRVATWARGFLN